MIVGIGSKDRFLSEEKLTELCREALRKKDFHSKNVFGFYAGGEEFRPLVNVFLKQGCNRLTKSIK